MKDQTKQSRAARTKQLRAKANELNGIILSRNLYVTVVPTGQRRRVIDAHVLACGDGVSRLGVRDLYSEHVYFVGDNTITGFTDGYGQEVAL